jgi:hypothetical protein
MCALLQRHGCWAKANRAVNVRVRRYGDQYRRVVICSQSAIRLAALPRAAQLQGSQDNSHDNALLRYVHSMSLHRPPQFPPLPHSVLYLFPMMLVTNASGRFNYTQPFADSAPFCNTRGFRLRMQPVAFFKMIRAGI